MGDKIKSMTIAIAVIGMLACVICFFVGNAAYQEDKDYIEYCSAYGGNTYGHNILREAGDNAYNGLQLRNNALVCGIIVLIGSMPLYGFGVLVDCNERQADSLNALITEQRKMNQELVKLLNEKNV